MLTNWIASLAALAVVGFGAFEASAADSRGQTALPRVVVIEDSSAAATAKPRIIKRFGNKKRIEKLEREAAKRAASRRGEYILVRDRMVRPEYKRLSLAGNRDKIARRVDPSVVPLGGRVILLKDTEGTPEAVVMKRFGNKKRIQKRLAGQRR